MIESMIGINIIIKLFLNDTLTNLKVDLKNHYSQTKQENYYSRF